MGSFVIPTTNATIVFLTPNNGSAIAVATIVMNTKLIPTTGRTATTTTTILTVFINMLKKLLIEGP